MMPHVKIKPLSCMFSLRETQKFISNTPDLEGSVNNRVIIVFKFSIVFILRNWLVSVFVLVFQVLVKLNKTEVKREKMKWQWKTKLFLSAIQFSFLV